MKLTLLAQYKLLKAITIVNNTDYQGFITFESPEMTAPIKDVRVQRQNAPGEVITIPDLQDPSSLVIKPRMHVRRAHQIGPCPRIHSGNVNAKTVTITDASDETKPEDWVFTCKID
jgi:hypothetical protein